MLPVGTVSLVSLVWLLACLMGSLDAKPGDKTGCCQCKTLQPLNPHPQSSYQIEPSPFKIKVHGDSYNKISRQGVDVSLVSMGGHRFTKFMLGGFAYPFENPRGNKDPKGRLVLKKESSQFAVKEACSGPSKSTTRGQEKDFSLVNDDDLSKSVLHFTWYPNQDTRGHIEFRATFVVDDQTYWVSEKSEPLEDPDSKNPLPRKRFIEAIDTSQCGRTKGCFSHPPGCTEANCQFILTWSDKNRKTEFELGGLTHGGNDRYVAVALSDDTYPGDDTVFTCAHNSVRASTEVYASLMQLTPDLVNKPIEKYDSVDATNPNKEYDFLESEEGMYQNARLRCRFTVSKALSNYIVGARDLSGKPAHLLFSYGYAEQGAPGAPWMSYDTQVPFSGASADAVDLTDTTSISGWATYPLVKAHGCLMILAWVLFNSIGMLFYKYYTQMWPNSRMFGHRYWRVGHVLCFILTFLFFLIGFICIMAATSTYAYSQDFSYRAHYVIGVIMLVCLIFVPIVALIRASCEGNCKVVWNWFYWLFLTVASVLSIPYIFIGMDFGAMGVPWWATWILVIWVIFYIIVELSLEVHQCCMYKKNKERRKKHEQAKQNNPNKDHPEPILAGRKFKRFMLSLHCGFTILISLIMIIIIAVA